MRINVAASHRFHLLDLARELEKQGHDVRFYSYVRKKRAESFGLKRECSRSLFYLMLPFLAMFKISKQAFWSVRLLHWALDNYVALFMRPCDVYIGLGTIYKKSFVSAKKKFGAITILEWGSKHIEEQQRILSQIPGVRKQPRYFIQRSLDGYELADFIAVPSDHAFQSFIERGIAVDKLIQNAYGVDLKMFRPTELDKNDVYDVIMVGAWSYQKGSDMVIDVCRKNNFSLLHVGTIVDVPFPKDDRMKHVDSVDQSLLVNFYSKARVFVLPSRQDGLAMVQLQALICGNPIVCSTNTGGRDLKKYIMDPKWIIEMDELTEKCLEDSIRKALDLAYTQQGIRFYAEGAKEQLTWEAYGKRYCKSIDLLSKL